jgi:hypothetical protein
VECLCLKCYSVSKEPEARGKSQGLHTKGLLRGILIPNLHLTKVSFIQENLFGTNIQGGTRGVVSMAVLSLPAQSEIQSYQKLEEAQEAARNDNKAILMVFAGSDWCRPCIQFKKEILESDDFRHYQNDDLVLLYLDFPSKKKNQLPDDLKAQNERLAEQFNKEGAFPKILLVDSELNVLSYLKFTNQQPSDFVKECQKILSK